MMSGFFFRKHAVSYNALLASRCGGLLRNVVKPGANAVSAADSPDPEIKRLKKALANIKERDRSILKLRADGFSYQSIGEFLALGPVLR